MPGGIAKHSVLIAGHRTSVSLEPEFWEALKEIAAARGESVNALVGAIDRGRTTNLSSAIRVFVLARYRGRRPEEGAPEERGPEEPGPEEPAPEERGPEG